ncbi:MAG: hypothetical protein ACOZQL_26205 [Myxococcota bacterium]
MTQRRLFPILFVVLTACETRSPSPDAARQQASLTQSASLRAFIDKTPRVAHVKVIAATGRAGVVGTAKNEALFTDLTLQVLAPLRGNGDSLALTTLGGRVGERAMHVSGQVALEAGDEAIVFVDPTVALHPFVGGPGGVLPVKDGRVFSYDGRPLVEVRPEGFVFGRAPDAPPAEPALEAHGTAKATRVAAPEGPALSVAEVLAALRALP